MTHNPGKKQDVSTEANTELTSNRLSVYPPQNQQLTFQNRNNNKKLVRLRRHVDILRLQAVTSGQTGRKRLGTFSSELLVEQQNSLFRRRFK